MSPVWRQGIVVPVEFTYEPVPWLSSNVRKVLPVVPSRLNATYRKLVERVDSSDVHAAWTSGTYGVQVVLVTWVQVPDTHSEGAWQSSSFSLASPHG